MNSTLRILVVSLSCYLFLSCSDTIDDTKKRNENWTWWVESKSQKGSWIPVKKVNPVKNGFYTLFYNNGKVYQTGKLLEGKKVDTVCFYDIRGHLQSYAYTIGDSTHHIFLKNGHTVQHTQTGKVKAEGMVKDNVFGDKWTTYYDNGKIKQIQNFSKNIGWITTYYDDGNVKDSSYQYGKDNLVSIKSWYQSGKLSSINHYKSANLTGTVLLFYENGVVRDSGLLVNGLAEGKVVKRFENGQIQFINHMKRNKPHGLQKAFYENGKLRLEAFMKDNSAHGELKAYDEKGKLIRHEIYSNGQLIKNKLYEKEE